MHPVAEEELDKIYEGLEDIEPGQWFQGDEPEAMKWKQLEHLEQVVRPFLESDSDFFGEDGKTPQREMTALEVKAVLDYARISEINVQVYISGLGLDDVPLTLTVKPRLLQDYLDTYGTDDKEGGGEVGKYGTVLASTDEAFKMSYEPKVGVYFDNVASNPFPEQRLVNTAVSGTQVSPRTPPYHPTHTLLE